MNCIDSEFGLLSTMKKVAICAALFFTCIGAHAECDDFDELAKIDGVEFEHVDKSMIDLAAKQGKTVTVGDNLVLGGDGEGEDFYKKFDDLRVFKCEENGNIKKFKKIALKLLKNKDFEPLIDTNGEDGEILKIYQSKDGEKSTHLVFAAEEEGAYLVIVKGTFDFSEMLKNGMNFNVNVNY